MAKKARTAKALLEREAKPAGPPEWGICDGCLKERRIDGNGIAVEHRMWVQAGGEVWNPAGGDMVPCPGAGEPVRVTT